MLDWSGCTFTPDIICSQTWADDIICTFSQKLHVMCGWENIWKAEWFLILKFVPKYVARTGVGRDAAFWNRPLVFKDWWGQIFWVSRPWGLIRLSKPTDMTIHWKALEHFLMVPFVFRGKFIFWIFLKKLQPLIIPVTFTSTVKKWPCKAPADQVHQYNFLLQTSWSWAF
jgi:hypothetical protein